MVAVGGELGGELPSKFSGVRGHDLGPVLLLLLGTGTGGLSPLPWKGLEAAEGPDVPALSSCYTKHR